MQELVDPHVEALGQLSRARHPHTAPSPLTAAHQDRVDESLTGGLIPGPGTVIAMLAASLMSPTLTAIDPLTSPNSSLIELVEAVRSLDYGRPNDRSVEGMLRERRGTCSTKHLFVAAALAERFPETQPQIVHRVYRLDRDRAHNLFGAAVAASVPDTGIVDVHRYLTATIDEERIIIDATFPGEPWDGRSSLPLACGPGQDHPAGADPEAAKRALEAEHCDPATREPFIAALTESSDAELRMRP